MDNVPQSLSEWMAYVDREIRAVCERTRMGYQIRRKWAEREKPLADSGIDDFEWKLIPDSYGTRPEDRETPLPSSEGYEGVYYLFTIDSGRNEFRVQHDTNHCGAWGRHHCMSTFTSIPFDVIFEKIGPFAEDSLRDFVLDVVEESRPNSFSIT